MEQIHIRSSFLVCVKSPKNSPARKSPQRALKLISLPRSIITLRAGRNTR